eukprot:gb/GECH01008581.1/.p1 GENE.gb/GECH01008581.1/~~gb/GECH01008581.1/.p1  ORF type:complete len:244 (+),score=22.33 gb/GECH01008581.1/:1-732(+)
MLVTFDIREIFVKSRINIFLKKLLNNILKPMDKAYVPPHLRYSTSKNSKPNKGWRKKNLFGINPPDLSNDELSSILKKADFSYENIYCVEVSKAEKKSQPKRGEAVKRITFFGKVNDEKLGWKFSFGGHVNVQPTEDSAKPWKIATINGKEINHSIYLSLFDGFSQNMTSKQTTEGFSLFLELMENPKLEKMAKDIGYKDTQTLYGQYASDEKPGNDKLPERIDIFDYRSSQSISSKLASLSF